MVNEYFPSLSVLCLVSWRTLLYSATFGSPRSERRTVTVALAAQPPVERDVEEQQLHEVGQVQRADVAALDVGPLVGQGVAQPLGVGAGALGQQDDRAEDAGHQRQGHAVADQQARAPAGV